MNTSTLVSHINEALAAHGGGPLVTTSTKDGDDRSTVLGKLGGHDVRVEFEVTSGKPDPGHSVALFDERSGEQVGRGDSGATFVDAITKYSWNGALIDLGQNS
ncbi:hypothetical protein B7R21_07795 [Subtercola boreus]|uniref:Uncharacterized protein n=1 Tax=Subtercola boreus TaxID=120213 RepID=A0A3E0VY21_9MICO|nr:hypothetical protein [Subtercola boreus]RFA13727.1 hypothetical protein B7R21_07795 [Subtercola boreus]